MMASVTSFTCCADSGGADRHRQGLQRYAALFVRKSRWTVPSGELVARVFELTPAELRVLLAIVEVGGVPETARRSVSPKQPSKPICTASSPRQGPAARRIWSSSRPDFPARWRTDARNPSHTRVLRAFAGLRRGGC